jgi:hypothetical protein
MITSLNNIEAAIKSKIAVGNKCYYALGTILKRRSISQSIKSGLYKTIIRPVVTIAETWTLISKMEKMLMSWERKILRKICGPTKENGQRRIKMNAELMTKYKAPDIVNVIKIQRLEWPGHVVRMNETRSVKKIFEGRLEGQIGRG